MKSNISKKFSNFSNRCFIGGKLCKSNIFNKILAALCFPPVPYAIFNHTYMCEICAWLKNCNPGEK